MKRSSVMLVVAALFVLAGFSISLAQEPIVYPAKGQSETKMTKDKGDCHAWAIKQTGIDPAAVAAQPAANPQSGLPGPQGQRLRGGARGAAGGAAVGAIAGDAGKGAAIGAVAGGMRQARQAREERKEEAKEAGQQAQSQKQQELSTYDRAFCACMEGRGYTVK